MPIGQRFGMAIQLIDAVKLIPKRLLIRRRGRLPVPIQRQPTPDERLQSSLYSRKVKQQVGSTPFRTKADFFASFEHGNESEKRSAQKRRTDEAGAKPDYSVTARLIHENGAFYGEKLP
jgi:hypothetical protein